MGTVAAHSQSFEDKPTHGNPPADEKVPSRDSFEAQIRTLDSFVCPIADDRRVISLSFPGREDVFMNAGPEAISC